MKVIRPQWIMALMGLIFFLETYGQSQKAQTFDRLLSANWKEVLVEEGTSPWQDQWFLDGLEARVEQTPGGFSFYAGPDQFNDSSHAVLWTKKSFKGDIKIEYDFTKLDDRLVNVNILYIQAMGHSPKPKDIRKWADQRTVPAMRLYFDHMDAYHISYAAFHTVNSDEQADYLQARRYMPEWEQGLKNTAYGQRYEKTGLFQTGVTYHLVVIKKGNDLYMQVTGKDEDRLFHWQDNSFPLINEGRIGLRQMYTRHSKYRNFKISTAK
ncbi:YesU family protein [Reichenbachiella carrageenanivorans]|uniref:YesU family protein n=1 Tax=Reichenbachiella carrageenanivorans TaxID=2979869 RepID=A0ABY6D5W0_9BACT|nr:YesU family protein [Reichenbachiella carrageenanivorans]UXX81294.1 YesU family protein [Reichenbachiella carrageenanivorans]